MVEVLRCKDVSVRRGDKVILDDISWTIDDSQRWVILGPNGAGKTTLLQIAAGRLFPSQGTVEILGEMLGGVDVFELRPRIGFASAVLADEIPRNEKVIRLVQTAAYGMMGTWRERYDESDLARAQSLLDNFNVGELANRPYYTLSEGERKRVQTARALMADPELLLLDEPAGGLDLGGREALLRGLENIATDPLSPVMAMVTHHVEEIPAGFTHALLLRDGRLVAAGELEEVLTPQNLSATFGLELTVERHRDRFTARAM